MYYTVCIKTGLTCYIISIFVLFSDLYFNKFPSFLADGFHMYILFPKSMCCRVSTNVLKQRENIIEMYSRHTCEVTRGL